MDNQIKIDETQYLNKTLKAMEKSLKTTAAEIKRTNKHIDTVSQSWGDVRLKTDTYSGIVETAASIRQQQQMLSERENSKTRAEHRFTTLTQQIDKPYFARIDFSESATDSGEAETIYIGLSSFSDDNNKFLVYDWRAPVASIYYDGGIGDVTYLTPDGSQRAHVTLKRQFQIEDGVIVTLFDTEEAIGDAMLMSALSGESSTKMKSIVTTIQKEQNKIIRNTAADLLFVQGAAGSGKTAAVLQRVAYLLYRYRGKLTSGQVVLFSPNQLFNDYIDNVLPELGEQNMVQMTFYQYASRRLPKMAVETLQARFEEDQTSSTIALAKGSLAMFDAVTAYAQHLNRKDLKLRSLMFRGEPLISKTRIAEIYYQYNDNYKLSQRLDATRDTLMRSLSARIGSEMRKDWVELAIENLSKQEYDTLVGAGKVRVGDDQENDAASRTRQAQLGDGPKAREFASEKAERQFLSRQIVTQALKPLARQIRRGSFLNINAQFVDLLRQLPNYLDLAQFDLTLSEWQQHVETVIDNLKNKQLSLTDTTLYLYLYDLITGKTGERDIRFLFIDEIQDYTPFQLAFLKFSFPRAKFTVLGDLNQAIFTKDNANNLSRDFAKLFDSDRVERVNLTQTYRSTQQITDFTKYILKGGQNIEAFNRSGQKPRVKLSPNEADMLHQLQQQLTEYSQQHDTTAIITKTLADAQLLSEQLQDTSVTLIQSENQRLAQGTIIVPSYLAKGLEFDAVIIWHADNTRYGQDSERRLLYTVASRAMHSLTLLAEKQVSCLLDHVPEKLYEVES
ncbi:RNA polymerase recycling motor HelD [Leuconostoc citreum]|uniref:Superfamily I DNA and RNA helicase n=1 Tax=Leuconostoc citreum (strain KM20) TaxID=349519 RepID=B1MW75_LEUCK|nr:RNA polymerase recycling motor HelD [Leuconostoc citreum]ACA83440.1 Superfamily I DNA and RNA helicase [Leuconostoc citreum KM20]QGN60797.1 AAA family ATPase [Leuconostoc citreum]QQE98070.1 AAA family ATPase [Leuconostoc citreum]TDM34176.1 ATP-dependent DNA helicase [Leuconostoc citreum]TPF01727.1 ATP-dependent DNA helicase [Leuconostoc citreum]